MDSVPSSTVGIGVGSRGSLQELLLARVFYVFLSAKEDTLVSHAKAKDRKAFERACEEQSFELQLIRRPTPGSFIGLREQAGRLMSHDIAGFSVAWNQNRHRFISET